MSDHSVDTLRDLDWIAKLCAVVSRLREELVRAVGEAGDGDRARSTAAA